MRIINVRKVLCYFTPANFLGYLFRFDDVWSRVRAQLHCIRFKTLDPITCRSGYSVWSFIKVSGIEETLWDIFQFTEAFASPQRIILQGAFGNCRAPELQAGGRKAWGCELNRTILKNSFQAFTMALLFARVSLDDVGLLDYITTHSYSQLLCTCVFLQSKLPSVSTFVRVDKCRAITKQRKQCTCTANNVVGTKRVCGIHRNAVAFIDDIIDATPVARLLQQFASGSESQDNESEAPLNKNK